MFMYLFYKPEHPRALLCLTLWALKQRTQTSGVYTNLAVTNTSFSIAKNLSLCFLNPVLAWEICGLALRSEFLYSHEFLC